MVKTNEHKNEIIKLYHARFDNDGPIPSTVGWKNQETQYLRFKELCRGFNLEGKKILDLGCGLGDFVDYAKTSNVSFESYIGIDICPKFIEFSEKKYFSENNVEFICSDFELFFSKFDSFVDIAICSGALSLNIGSNWNLAKMVMERSFYFSKEAVSFNFLSSFVDYKLEKNFHFEPSKMLEFAKGISRWVNLFHDYPLYEFTLQILKKDRYARN